MITTTDGRGGIPSAKSGQRVAGFSNDHRIGFGILFAGMLYREEQCFVVRREHRPAHFGADRYAEEHLRLVPRMSPSVSSAQTPSVVPVLSYCRPVGGDPQPALGVDRAVIRQAEPAVLVVAGCETGADSESKDRRI